jgi:hypothetical protein
LRLSGNKKTQCLGQSQAFFFPKIPKKPLLFRLNEPFLLFFPKRSFETETLAFVGEATESKFGIVQITTIAIKKKFLFIVLIILVLKRKISTKIEKLASFIKKSKKYRTFPIHF